MRVDRINKLQFEILMDNLLNFLQCCVEAGNNVCVSKTHKKMLHWTKHRAFRLVEFFVRVFEASIRSKKQLELFLALSKT